MQDLLGPQQQGEEEESGDRGGDWRRLDRKDRVYRRKKGMWELRQNHAQLMYLQTPDICL